MLKPRTEETAAAARDEIEREISKAVGRAVRMFLARMVRESRGTVDSLTAASTPMTLGEAYGWWDAAVSAEVMQSVHGAFRVIWEDVSDGKILSTSLDGAERYAASVKDRLVRGLDPSLPDDAFDKVRVSLASGMAEGWSKDELSRRIGAELSWDKNGPYWQSERSRAESAIDAILDPLGGPGTPAREWARMNDPRVRELQGDMSRAAQRIAADDSHWKMRADRIARTEATGAAGYATLDALGVEGAVGKEWLSGGGPRTRPTHAAANGQVQALDKPFEVGGFPMMMPGDPSGPAKEVVNCRCVLVGVDDPALVPGVEPEPVEPEPEPEEVSQFFVDGMSDEQIDRDIGILMARNDYAHPRFAELTAELDRRDGLANMVARSVTTPVEDAGAVTEILARRAPATAKAAEQELRAEWEGWNYTQWLRAEEDTRGVLLNKEGQKLYRQGRIDPDDFFTGKRSLKYASPELQEWFARPGNQRLSFPEYRSFVRDDRAARAAGSRRRNKGWESEYG